MYCDKTLSSFWLVPQVLNSLYIVSNAFDSISFMMLAILILLNIMILLFILKIRIQTARTYTFATSPNGRN